jgi:hypothetical protein
MKKFPSPLGLALAVASLWFVGGFLLPLVASSEGSHGEFGDKFGAINALFSGLAFAGVIYAILLQRQELELQREELRMTRQELERSTAAQQHSADALSAQLRVAALSSKLSALSALLQSSNDKIAQDQRLTSELADKGIPSDMFMSNSSLYKDRKKHEAALNQLLDELSKIGG